MTRVPCFSPSGDAFTFKAWHAVIYLTPRSSLATRAVWSGKTLISHRITEIDHKTEWDDRRLSTTLRTQGKVKGDDLETRIQVGRGKCEISRLLTDSFPGRLKEVMRWTLLFLKSIIPKFDR